MLLQAQQIGPFVRLGAVHILYSEENKEPANDSCCCQALIMTARDPRVLFPGWETVILEDPRGSILLSQA